jgi:hypothetical protein
MKTKTMTQKRAKNTEKTDRDRPSGGAAKLVGRSRGILFISTLLFLASLLGGVVSHAQKKVDEGPEVITLEDYAVTEEAVTFTHKNHGKTGEVGADCMTCHHTSNKFETPGKCSECHKAKEEEEVLSHHQAFHVQCIGCHKEEIVAGVEALNLTCESCHVPK